MTSLSEHPFRGHSKSVFGFKRKICEWYGVKDADRWFQHERRQVVDLCRTDRLGIAQFTSLEELWEHKHMAEKWDDPPRHPRLDDAHDPHAVDIYTVRAPGAGGELGILTTAHDLDAFITGLATATAKYVFTHRDTNQQQIERDLAWIYRNAFPIAFKLSGYKADQVIERHLLMCGSNAPAADDIVASA